MKQGTKDALVIGTVLNLVANGIVDSVEGKRKKEAQEREELTRTNLSTENVIDDFLKENEIFGDKEFYMMVTQFKKLTATCEEMFPDINLAGRLLDDLAIASKSSNPNSLYGQTLENRKNFMMRLIMNMRVFIARNIESTEDIRDELANFQYKMEYATRDSKIKETIKELIYFGENLVHNNPFYVKGKKVKIDVKKNFDSKYGKFKTEEEANQVATKMNEIYEQVLVYKKEIGGKSNTGMLIDIAMNPENARNYKLELKGTTLGKQFGV